jgi:hypothetical protein
VPTVKTYLFTFFILSFIFAVSLLSQETPDKIVEVNLVNLNKEIKAGSVVNFELSLKIKKGWHINSNKPLDENLVPTVIEFNDTVSYSVLKIKYAQPVLKKLSFSENILALYEYLAVIKIQILIKKDFKKQNLIVNGKIQYQPCDNQTCLFPVTKSFTADLIIAGN